MEGWKEYKISDVIDEISMGPFGSNIKVDNFIDFGVPVLNGSNLQGFKLQEESFNYVSQEKADSLGKANAHRGDVVITHRGTVGQIVYIPQDSKFEQYVISQSQFRLKLKQDLIRPDFFVYFFHTPIGQHRILMNASQVGVPALARPTTTFKEVFVLVPPLETQNAIMAILSSLDNKIEINKRVNDNFAFSLLILTCFILWILKLRNDNLQQQARALYKSWFVDFEPFKNGEFEESELGFIPKGWNVYEFGRVLSPVNEKVGDRVVTEYSVGNAGIRSRSDIYHKAICSNPEKNRIIRRGNLVFGMGNDRVTWGIMKDEIGATSPAYPAYKIDENIDYIYFEFFFKHYYAQAKDLIRPSVRQGQTIDKGALMQKKIYVPSKNVWDRFLHIHNPIIETSRCVEIESDRLSDLRDVLLPRLMSGELKVSEMNV